MSMTAVALISDIHANIDALEAVLADIAACGVNEIVCLGDAVGYGGAPAEVVRLLRRRRIPTLMGNHEFALAHAGYRASLNPVARESLEIQERFLAPDDLAWLAGLPAVLFCHGARLVHGCPPDSVNRYLFDPRCHRLRGVFASYPERLAFFGHTHLLHHYRLAAGGGCFSTILSEGTVHLQPDDRHLINVGSVGQPRDGDNRAVWYCWLPAADRLEVHRVAYDIETAMERILTRGLPPGNAARLR